MVLTTHNHTRIAAMNFIADACLLRAALTTRSSKPVLTSYTSVPSKAELIAIVRARRSAR